MKWGECLYIHTHFLYIHLFIIIWYHFRLSSTVIGCSTQFSRHRSELPLLSWPGVPLADPKRVSRSGSGEIHGGFSPSDQKSIGDQLNQWIKLGDFRTCPRFFHGFSMAPSADVKGEARIHTKRWGNRRTISWSSLSPQLWWLRRHCTEPKILKSRDWNRLKRPCSQPGFVLAFIWKYLTPNEQVVHNYIYIYVHAGYTLNVWCLCM